MSSDRDPSNPPDDRAAEGELEEDELDVEVLSEFNRYTLAVAAGAFAYAMEKIGFGDVWSHVALSVLIFGCFIVSVLSGVLLFAHATTRRKNRRSPSEHNARTERLGKWHTTPLFVGLVLFTANLMVHFAFERWGGEAETVDPCEACACVAKPAESDAKLEIEVE